MKVRAPMLLLALICVVALYGRSAGLFRGLHASPAYIFHSDSSRQVAELNEFLHNKYFHYAANRTHDGYPYFLNHFDEWILRIAWPAYRATQTFFSPDNPAPPLPDRLSLFFCARSLRVLYGLAVVLLVYATARAMRLGRPAALFASLAVALAPVSIAISHSATGDIGTDLFSSLALLFLARFAKADRKGWLILLGIAIAFTFASKYHGVLVALPAFLYFLPRLNRAPRGPTLASASMIAFAFLFGLAVAMPHLVTAWDRSTHDILAYLAYVKNHRVDEAFLQQSFLSRAWFGITTNTIPVLGALGIVLAVLALAGTAHAAVTLMRGFRSDAEPNPEQRRVAIAFAICMYPWIVIALALAGKRNVQPFHFSFVQIPLALGAAYCVDTAWRQGSSVRRIACGLLVSLALLELGHTANRETYFWKREDSRRIAKIFDADVMRFGMRSEKWPHNSEHVVKKLFLEPSNPSVFRNRPRCIVTDDPEYWASNHVPLCATVPFPNAPYWIFCNGPVFLRNDRLFHVPTREKTLRELVLYTQPARIRMGIRSASHPIDLTINLGGDRQRVRMAPNDQQIVAFEPVRWQHAAPARNVDEDIYRVPLEIHSRAGDAWTSILDDERAALNFRTFGFTDVDTVRERLAHYRSAPDNNPIENAYYVSAEKGYDVTIGADDTTTLDLFPLQTVLGNGAYVLALELTAVREDMVFDVVVADPVTGIELSQTAQQLTVPAGSSGATYRFVKPYAPYRCTVRLRSRSGGGRLVGWSLRPDAQKIETDLQHALVTGKLPEWSARFDSSWKACESGRDAIATFRGTCELLDLQIPDELRPGQTFEITCCVRLEGFPAATLPESAFFVHMIDGNGVVVAVFGWGLANCVYESAAAPRQIHVLSADIVPGTYEIKAGMWNPRLRSRYLAESEALPVDHANRLIKIGRILVK